MAILQFNTEFAGQTGILPRLARMVTNDTYSTVTKPGYINSNYASGNPPLNNGDFLFISYIDVDDSITSQMFVVSKDGNEIIVNPTIMTNEITQGGNAFGEPVVIGAQDNYGVNFITNNNTAVYISSAGAVNLPLLNPSAAVVTDASTNLASYPYSAANIGTSLVARDSIGNFSANEIVANGLILNGAGGSTTLLPSSSMITSYSLRLPPTQGAPNTFLHNDGLGNLSWMTEAGTGNIAQGGNSFGANVVVGSLDNYGLDFITNGNTYLSISNSGILNVDSLDASEVVATDVSKNLITITYTNSNTGDSLVFRDSSGDFSANEITADLLGNATTATTVTMTPDDLSAVPLAVNFTDNTDIFYGTKLLFTPSTGLLSSAALSVTGNVNFDSLTASQAVVTNGGKNLVSLAYTSANAVSTLVSRDGSGNFGAGTITATLNGNASSATNATNVSITNDNSTNFNHPVMFSPLNSGFQAPRVSSFYFTFNPSTGTALIRDIQASFSMRAQFMSTGIVHSNASGNFSSSLIVNADIDAAAAIADTKLATISTAGKVSNSATTATNLNTANAIVARDASGNFAAGNAALGSLNVTGTTNLAGITATRVVATNASQNLVGLTYGPGNANNSLAQRGATGTLSATGFLFAGQTTPFDANTVVQGPNVITAQAKCYAWNIYSDENIKENIQDIDPQQGLDKVLAIRSVCFDWVEGQGDNIPDCTPQKQIGYLANDVKAHAPCVTCDDENGVAISVDYAKLSVLHAAAIKRLNALIADLTVQVNAINSFLGL